MKFLANENFPLDSVYYLKNRGFDIIHIGTDFSGIKDEIVIQMAIDEKRTILTFDKDYGELIMKYNHKPTAGVIYFRLQHYSGEDPGKILADLINKFNIDFSAALTVIDENSIRQRKY